MHRVLHRAGLAVAVMLAASCQRYDWVYVPDTNRTGVHLPFSVQTPSKADVVFVIDNSDSMASKQVALGDSLSGLLATLAPNDTSYRIGIVSTDTIGWTADCAGNPYTFPASWLPTALDRCDKPGVVLRRPHDGAFGRLLAAYSPEWFNPTNTAYAGLLTTPERVAAFNKLVPTSATEGPRDADGKPTSVTGVEGVPWVIDRDIIRADACNACACDCAAADFKKSTCYTGCVEPVSAALVRAFFSSSIEGLGTSGSGWEQGVRASLLSVGINPDLSLDNAIDHGDSTMKPGGPNLVTVLDATGRPVRGAKWLRDEAILGVMYVSDEQDCSMPVYAYPGVRALEEPRSQPVGSGCYQKDGLALLTETSRVITLLKNRKGGSAARLATGFIGGVRPGGPAESPYIAGTASDCYASPGTGTTYTPSYSCQCLASAPLDQRWCSYTENLASSSDKCDALAGSRYVDVVDGFSRHIFDSICQSNFGPALSEFAKRLISACFELDLTVQPAANLASNIEVIRTPKAEQGESATPGKVAYLSSCGDAGPGWCYVPAVVTDATNTQKPQVCLVGFDRLIGDFYDIFVLTKDKYDPTH